MIIEVCTQGALPGGVVVFFWTLATWQSESRGSVVEGMLIIMTRTSHTLHTQYTRAI